MNPFRGPPFGRELLYRLSFISAQLLLVWLAVREEEYGKFYKGDSYIVLSTAFSHSVC